MSAPIMMIAGSVISGVAQIGQARAQQAQYEQQAYNEKIKGRQDAVNYKREGIERLRELNRAMAATSARAAAGGVLAFKGNETKRMINLASTSRALGELRTLDLNAENAILQANANAASAQAAGQAAVRMGTLAAIGNVATGIGVAQSYGPILGTTPT